MLIFWKYELSLFQNMGMPCEPHHYPTPTYSFTGGGMEQGSHPSSRTKNRTYWAAEKLPDPPSA